MDVNVSDTIGFLDPSSFTPEGKPFLRPAVHRRGEEGRSKDKKRDPRPAPVHRRRLHGCHHLAGREEPDDNNRNLDLLLSCFTDLIILRLRGRA